eukprot:scaffold18882_cov119-Skeletonema_marinoi.AAC.1
MSRVVDLTINHRNQEPMISVFDYIIKNLYLLLPTEQRHGFAATVLLLLHLVVWVERHNSDGHAIASRPRSG